MTLISEVPTPLKLREMLEALVVKDLLGPAGGDDEIVDERSVRSRYIVGLLAPKKSQGLFPDPLDPPDEVGELAEGGQDDSEQGKAEAPTPQPDFAAMLPSSMGITFSVDAQATEIVVMARWGHYQRVRSEQVLTASGDPKMVWQRTQIEGISDPIPLKSGDIYAWFPDPGNQDVYVRGLVRQHDGAWTVTLFLINAQTEPKIRRDEAWLFQPELRVQAPNGEAIFVRRQLPSALGSEDPEDRSMAMLYRHEVEFAVGHGVGVHAEISPFAWDHAVEVKTVVVPAYDVEQMQPPTPEDIPELASVITDMKALSELQDGQFTSALRALADAYAAWIERQEHESKSPGPDLEPYQTEGQLALKACHEALDRICAGIELLDSDPRAAEAFRFANRAMWYQRVQTIRARLSRQGQPTDEADVPKNRSWRPFQLAFVLLNLPSLVNPAHPERSDPVHAYADLLWFPTGGGKTEAYLGVAAFTMAIRRLQGDLGGRSGQAGVAVLMRYTLRLLTLQQFQRATTLICACEIIRRENPDLWGLEPFRIGLWVGQKSTPNWTKDAAEAIKADRGSGWSGSLGGKGTPAQLTNCPWCGKPINPGKDIHVELVESGRGRTFQYCGDELGKCPFSRRQSPDEGLPVVVVDEEIYRRLPTLLIATVDKFAQMPWKGETQMLFGQVNGYCPRHGYRSPEIDDSDSHPKKGDFPACKTQPVTPLRPPDLIIQDELHLISGPLGTLVGLYETAVDALASWELDGVTVRPKVIASTATIRRAHHQVNSLFLREVKIFPPSALDAGDNFFSLRRPNSDTAPGRRYLGICASGTRLKAALIRVYVAYMSAAQQIYEQYNTLVDPWMTLVGYFNSVRELGGMKRVVDDAVRTRLLHMEERGLANRRIDPGSIEELTSRRGASDIPRILDRLETVFAQEVEAQRRAKIKEKEFADLPKRPLDIVLATNMISVGVDVGRLGLMVVASQPKATAEYIQATSRVGRAFPGMVCTVYNWTRPRDLSHYERFEHYHATFYQQVEALSVTPFSPRALDRGLTGVLASYVRLFGDDYNANDRAGKINADHPNVKAAIDMISRRAGLVNASTKANQQVRKMIKSRMDKWQSEAKSMTGGAILGYQTRKDGRTRGLLHQPTEEDWSPFTCLNSLRDVEPDVPLVLNDYGMDREPGQPVVEESEVTE